MKKTVRVGVVVACLFAAVAAVTAADEMSAEFANSRTELLRGEPAPELPM